MKAKLFVVLIVFACFGQTFAAERPGAVFLIISPGARQVAMGSAFTGLCDDASLLYYNPGGLGLYNTFEFTIMNQGPPPGLGRVIETGLLDIMDEVLASRVLYGSGYLNPDINWLPGLHPDMQYIYGTCIVPMKNLGNLGVHYTYLTTGPTSVIDPEGNYVGEYETYDYAVGISYGRSFLNNRLGFGLSGKYIYSYLVPDWVWESMPELGIDAGGTGSAVAVDAGAIFRMWGVGIGVALQNLGTRMGYTEGDSDRLPTRFRWGIAFEPIIFVDRILSQSEHAFPSISRYFDAKIARDVSYDKDDFNDSWESFGIELTVFDIFSWRYGTFDDDDGARHGNTWGIGFNLRNVAIDIADDSEIYEFATNNWRVQISLRAQPPPERFQFNETLNKSLTIACATLAPGGGQFYKGEGIKGALFFIPSLYLGREYYRHESGSRKTLSLVGIGALYALSAAEALLN
jgi:hypothetical protein